MSEFDLSGQIDLLLAEQRPDRYEPGYGDDWLDDIAAAVAHLVPLREAQYRSARLIVGQREAVKSRRSNRLLREVRKSGELPSDWLATLNLPLAVGKERVALRACTPKDFKDFAYEERRNAAREFATRNETCEAAEWLYEKMVAAGIENGAALSQIVPVGDSPAEYIDESEDAYV